MDELKISEFKLSDSWLSNFYPCKITVDGIGYPSVEHAYQAAKVDDINIKKAIAALNTAGKAKRAGKALELKPDWDTEKLIVMESLLRIKFSIPDFKVLLIRTYPAILEEGNYWKDTYWGIYPPRSSRGENHLGKILMQLRDELRKTGRLL